MVAKPPEMDDFATIPGVSAVGDVSVVGDVAVVGDAYLRWRAAGELTDPVLVEDGRSGGSVAAPIAKSFLDLYRAAPTAE